jgi:hypothetical protein
VTQKKIIDVAKYYFRDDATYPVGYQSEADAVDIINYLIIQKSPRQRTCTRCRKKIEPNRPSFIVSFVRTPWPKKETHCQTCAKERLLPLIDLEGIIFKYESLSNTDFGKRKLNKRQKDFMNSRAKKWKDSLNNLRTIKNEILQT